MKVNIFIETEAIGDDFLDKFLQSFEIDGWKLNGDETVCKTFNLTAIPHVGDTLDIELGGDLVPFEVTDVRHLVCSDEVSVFAR